MKRCYTSSTLHIALISYSNFHHISSTGLVWPLWGWWWWWLWWWLYSINICTYNQDLPDHEEDDDNDYHDDDDMTIIWMITINITPGLVWLWRGAKCKDVQHQQGAQAVKQRGEEKNCVCICICICLHICICILHHSYIVLRSSIVGTVCIFYNKMKGTSPLIGGSAKNKICCKSVFH